jgi:uncharacterized protein YdaU (DUF1376 family)
MSTKNNKRPSFQFYPSDWLSDPNVIIMSAEERGAYIQLLALMWNTENCSLKDDPEYLAKLAGVDNSVITQLYHCFKSVNGMLRHKRLDQEREKQDEYRKSKSEGGKKGMEVRWKLARESQNHNSVITGDNSSSPSSSPSSINITPNEALGDVKEIFEYFKEQNRVSRVVFNAKKKEKVNARLKSFTKEEIMRAIKNRANDPFMQGDNEGGKEYRKDFMSLFRNDEQIEKWLNKEKVNPLTLLKNV